MTTMNSAILIGSLAQSMLMRETGTNLASSLLSGNNAQFQSLGLLKGTNPIPSIPGIKEAGLQGLEDFINKSVPNNTQLLKDLTAVVALGSFSSTNSFSQFDMAKATYLYGTKNDALGNMFRSNESLINSLF